MAINDSALNESAINEPGGIMLSGENLTVAPAISSGAITTPVYMAAMNLQVSPSITTGKVTDRKVLLGSNLTVATSENAGAIKLNATLESGGLSSGAAIQTGELFVVSYALTAAESLAISPAIDSAPILFNGLPLLGSDFTITPIIEQGRLTDVSGLSYTGVLKTEVFYPAYTIDIAQH